MFFVFACGGVVLFVAVCFAVYDYDLSVANPLSTYDILLPGTMTAAIVMMSAASVQKKCIVTMISHSRSSTGDLHLILQKALLNQPLHCTFIVTSQLNLRPQDELHSSLAIKWLSLLFCTGNANVAPDFPLKAFKTSSFSFQSA